MKQVVPIYVWLGNSLERITRESHHFAVPADLARVGFAEGGMFVREIAKQELEAVRVGRSFELKPKERRKQARSRTRGRRGSRRIGYKYDFRCTIHMLDVAQKNAAIRELAKLLVDPIAEAFGKDPQCRHWPDGWSALYTHAESLETSEIWRRREQFMAENKSRNEAHR